MAITTLDGVIAGMQAPKPITKVGIATTVGAMRGYTLWYAAGNPGAATANAAGINGAAVYDGVGGIPRTNPVSGNSYLARLGITASTAGSLWLIDRLWNNSGGCWCRCTGWQRRTAVCTNRHGCRAGSLAGRR